MKDDNKKVSRDQKEVLLSFMENHLDLARGRLPTTERRIMFKSLWLVLTEQLNSRGRGKTVQQWQRTWTDLKLQVKRKIAELKASQKKKGGGPISTKLSDFDNRVLQVMTEKDVFGIPDPEKVTFVTEQPHLASELVLTEAGPSGKRRTPESLAKETKRIKTSSIPQLEGEDNGIVEDEEEESRTCVAAAANEELKILSRDTNNSIKEIKNEITELNKTFERIAEQNEEQAIHRIQTNKLLERIAKALERQSS